MAAHNEERYIGRALESVFSQSVKPSKVIVVLDRCSDRTGEIARRFPVEIVEKTEKKWLFSYAENLEMAWRRTDTPFVAIVDADVVLEPNYFEFLLSKITEEVCCVGGKIETVSGTLLGRLLRLWERTYRVSPNRRPRGCALLVRREVLEKIGGFADVPAPDTYVQDQAIRLGYKVLVVEEVKAYHIRDVTLSRAFRTQFNTGIGRYVMGKSLLMTLGHSVVRLRPLVAVGYVYAALSREKRALRKKILSASKRVQLGV
jgi:glycosyltransferase involved in cell wall biosynthesis